MFLRVRNQNDVVVNLPSAVPRDFETDADHRVLGPDPHRSRSIRSR